MTTIESFLVGSLGMSVLLLIAAIYNALRSHDPKDEYDVRNHK